MRTDPLAEAIAYHIYPASFADSNGDGIGDIPGITGRLDYLSWLGVTHIWLSPCFESAFRDGGYDITNYYDVAPRYGTQDDLGELVEQARNRGIRVLLDLVPGHTSDQHPWFQASEERTAGFADRFIWSGEPVDGFVPSRRRGDYYLPNFFPHQPALNFGYARQDPSEPWRQPVDAQGPQANRQELKRIAKHWLDLGISGFRVDMAFSLVKDDPDWVETSKLWNEFRSWLDRDHADAVLMAEWGMPLVSRRAGFHADFFLHFNGKAMRSLWDNGAGTFDEKLPEPTAYFDERGGGTMKHFLHEWGLASSSSSPGVVLLPTANHDFQRLACGRRQGQQLKVAMTFLLTWPTVPTIYYGEEIGMRYLPDLPDKEGSVTGPNYNRAGSRTPMQWDDTPNAGFSAAPGPGIYLPIDPDPDRPTVTGQQADPASLLNLTRELIALRRTTPALGPSGQTEVLRDGYPFCYTRSQGTERYLIILNPLGHPATTELNSAGLHAASPVTNAGIQITDGRVTAQPFGYAIFRW